METVVVAPEPRLRHLEVALHRMERNHEGHRIFGANHYEPVVSVNQVLGFYLVAGSGGNISLLVKKDLGVNVLYLESRSGPG